MGSDQVHVMNIEDLEGVKLNWAFATSLGVNPQYDMESHGRTWYGWWISTPEYESMPNYVRFGNDVLGVIERMHITLDYQDETWVARCIYKNDDSDDAQYFEEFGSTPIIAVMRCSVAAKLGRKIKLPAVFSAIENKSPASRKIKP